MNGRRQRQGGWFLIVILIALAIAAYLYKDALKAYLMQSVPPPPTHAGTPGERVRSPGAIGGEALDVSSAPSAPQAPMDRARGIEDMVKQQAQQRENRGDGSTR
jgi:hypothetical protein